MTTDIRTTVGAPEGEPDELLIHFVDMFAAQTPDAVAIRYGDQVWTWMQWRERIGRLAAALRAAGVARGDRIAFLDKNHPAAMEATFAAASLGATIAILNWRLSEDEVGYAVRDSGARLLFIGEEFLQVGLSARDGAPDLERVITVGPEGGAEYDAMLAAHTPSGASADVTPADAAVLIYSSGTTGRPKGVVLSQQALVAHTRNVGTSFPFEPGDVNLVAMPLFHVGGVCYAFFGIRAGVPTIMTRTADPAALLSALGEGPTHALLVPPVINGLLSAGEPTTSAVARLKYLVYGAAPTPLPLLRKALAAWPSVNFVQVYGQTELSGVVLSLLPDHHRDDTLPQALVSAGKPVPGAELRIADVVTGEPVPVGEQGELWFRTRQRMTGYLNAPEATAATITPDGWLRTGDIGRVRHRWFRVRG